VKIYRLGLALIIYTLSFDVNAQSFLLTPISGDYGKDYTIVNYVDWALQGHQDAYCGSKSYDSHQGTDFVIRSFKQMDSGVYVLAADTGIVTFIQDGLFDREKVSDTAKGFGNYIAIEHSNGYYTYYAHLKKNSILIQLGDTVIAGQKMAKVGSSGNSTDPHLHFELWFDSLYVVDPFRGDCGNDSALWIDSLAYDTSLSVWEHGLYLKNININTLRERDSSNICCPYEIVPASDTLSFWTHMYGIREGDTLTIDWIDSSNVTQFSYDFVTDKDHWYYYFWSYILTDSLKLGNWQVVLSRNRKGIITETFEVKPSASTSLYEYMPKYENCIPYHLIVSGLWRSLLERDAITVYQLNGVTIGVDRFFSNPKAENQTPNIYIIKTLQKDQMCTYKTLF